MSGYTATLSQEHDALYSDNPKCRPSLLQRDIYHLLKRSMDRETGIAGIKSRISYGGIYERVYEPARQGYAGTGDAWGKTRTQRIKYIQNQVRRLEALGLIKIVTPEGDSLQIEFLIFNQFRDTHFSVQKKLTSNLRQSRGIPKNDEKAIENKDLACGQVEEVTIPQNAKLTTYPIYINQSINQGDSPRFLMTTDWRPSERFNDLCRLSMIDIAGEHQALYGETLSELVLYWTTEQAKERYPERLMRSQSEWERALLKQLVRAKSLPKPIKSLPVKPVSPTFIKPRFSKQEALRQNNHSVANNWIPPELRENCP